MTNPERRLQRLQRELIYRMAREAGEPLGVSAEEVIDEALELLSWPPDELARELAAWRHE